jgi:zinc protease
MFEGSAHVPPGAFDTWLQEVGGQANAATGEDATFYWLDLPPQALELAMFLESDRMGFMSGAIDERLLEEQKRIVAAERAYIAESDPSVAEEWVARPALFPDGHPYHEPVIGRAEELVALSLEELLDFHARHYRPANASLVIAGDIDVEVTLALVKKWFSEIPGGEASQRPVAVTPVLREQRGIVRESNSSTTRLTVHWSSAPAASPDHAALVVLADLLAGGAGSRLHEALVREQGLAVSVSARQEGLRLGGAFTITVETVPDRSLGSVLDALDHSIATLIEAGPARKEVRRASEGLATRFLGEIERLGGFRGRSYRINEIWARGGNPAAYAADAVRYRAVRPADLRRVAERWLGPGRVVVTTVPAGRRDLAAGVGETQ